MLSVGVDIGTTRTKAIAIDAAGDTRAVEAIATPWSIQRGRRVLASQPLLATVTSLLARVLDSLPGERIASIGFTSIAESGFLCTLGGDALVAAAPWSDPGGADAAAEFESDFGGETFSRITGLRLSSTPSLFKLRELGRTARWDQPLRWLSVAEWLAVQFGAAPRSERSLASRTGLIDITQDRMDEELRGWSGLPLVETELVWAGDPVGEVTSAGPLSGATIVVGGHDHLCAAMGAEATSPGDVLNSFGTAEAYIAAVEVAGSPGEVLARHRAGLETGYHVVRGAHSLIIGAAHGSDLSRVLQGLGGSMEALESKHPGPVAAVAASSAPPQDAAAAHWMREVRLIHARSLGMARVIEAHTSVARVVGTGGWLQSACIRELKRRDLPRFVLSPREETAARGAALLAAGVAFTC